MKYLKGRFSYITAETQGLLSFCTLKPMIGSVTSTPDTAVQQDKGFSASGKLTMIGSVTSTLDTAMQKDKGISASRGHEF